jgi:DNA repair protein SbcD/Mre11
VIFLFISLDESCLNKPVEESFLFRFIHAADVHLDSPLRGLQRYPGAPTEEIRGASRKALINLVDFALEQQVDFVLIAGDLYDGDWKDHHTGLFFTQQMSRLRESEIPVIVIAGNHDAANKMTKTLQLPENMVMLSAKHAETASVKALEQLGVAIHGRSFARAAETENFALGYPSKIGGMFNIGVLHTALDGAEGHARYAPCTVQDLQNKGYDYWALGHVHDRRVISHDPYIVFSGNIQGRHIRETGAKGCYLVEVNSEAKIQLHFQPLDVMRWLRCQVDIQGAAQPEEILSSFSDHLQDLTQQHAPLPAAVRVALTGATEFHDRLIAESTHWTNEIRACAIDVSGGSVWVEKVSFDTKPSRPLSADQLGDGPLGELINTIDSIRADEEKLRELISELSELKRKLPEDLLHGQDAVGLGSPEQLKHWLDEVLPLLTSRLGIGRSP